MNCPRCWSEIVVGTECLCDACGWFGDPKELLTTPGKGYNLIQAVIKALDSFRDGCRSELLMEQLCEGRVCNEKLLDRATMLRRGATHSLIEMFVKLKIRPNLPEEILRKSPNGLLDWPTNWIDRRYNACNDPCDVLIGPCACGAWHYESEDWVQQKLKEHQAVII